jgi:hypothetical protein
VDQDPSRIKSAAKDGGGAFCVLSGVRGFDFARRVIPNRSKATFWLFFFKKRCAHSEHVPDTLQYVFDLTRV